MRYFLIALGALVLGLLLEWAWVRLREVRRYHAVRAVAQRLGLQATHGDPHNLTRLPFRIADRGTNQRVPITMHGTRGTTPVRVFDLEYRRSLEGSPEVLDFVGTPTGAVGWEAVRRFLNVFTRVRLTCAAIEIPQGRWPNVSIDARGAAARRSTRQALARTIDLESDEFNRVFHVTSDDRKFTFTLIDALTMHWLLGNARQLDIEVGGRWVLVVSEQLPPARWPDLHVAVTGFVARLPNLVFEDHGGVRPVASVVEERHRG